MKQNLEKRRQRLAVLAKMKAYEALGGDYFFKDLEDDPPSRTLMPNEVDYLYRKPLNRVKAWVANGLARYMVREMKQRRNITAEGLAHLQGIQGGAILTSNHFDPFDSAAIRWAVRQTHPRAKVYTLIREGNFFMPGALGFLLKYGNTLPLSGNPHTLMNLYRAMETLLARGDFLLIYPEQAMWWNYRKPRPHRIGAYAFACRYRVPIVPCFITMRDLPTMDEAGFPEQQHTLHVMTPLYPDDTLPPQQARQRLCEADMALCRAAYLEAYGGER